MVKGLIFICPEHLHVQRKLVGFGNTECLCRRCGQRGDWSWPCAPCMPEFPSCSSLVWCCVCSTLSQKSDFVLCCWL